MDSRYTPTVPSLEGFSDQKMSTVTCLTLLTVVSDFLHSFGKAFLCFIDIKDAFDSVAREFMIRELVKVGYPKIYVRGLKGSTEENNVHPKEKVHQNLETGMKTRGYEIFTVLKYGGKPSGIISDEFGRSYL